MGETKQDMVWVDLEMTGLDPARCAVVEIATLITDSDLNVLAEGPCIVIHQTDEVLATMDDFVRAMHTRSGLVERIRASSVSLDEAAAETLAFLERHCEKKKGVLCGNSVWKDRAFLEVHMPSVVDFLHYRMIDVSTVKELVRRWYSPDLLPKKKETHRALDDILESLDELRFYRSKVFAPK